MTNRNQSYAPSPRSLGEAGKWACGQLVRGLLFLHFRFSPLRHSSMATSLLASASSLRLATRAVPPLRSAGAGSSSNTQIDLVRSDSTESSPLSAQQCARSTAVPSATPLELDSPFYVAESSSGPRFDTTPFRPHKRCRQSSPQRALVHAIFASPSPPRPTTSQISSSSFGNQQRLLHTGLSPQDCITTHYFDSASSLAGSHLSSVSRQPPPIPKSSYCDIAQPEVVEKKRNEPELIATKSQPRMDELNTLLRHPTLYDPVCVPRFPLVLCHGQSFSPNRYSADCLT